MDDMNTRDRMYGRMVDDLKILILQTAPLSVSDNGAVINPKLGYMLKSIGFGKLDMITKFENIYLLEKPEKEYPTKRKYNNGIIRNFNQKCCDKIAVSQKVIILDDKSWSVYMEEYPYFSRLFKRIEWLFMPCKYELFKKINAPTTEEIRILKKFLNR